MVSTLAGPGARGAGFFRPGPAGTRPPGLAEDAVRFIGRGLSEVRALWLAFLLVIIASPVASIELEIEPLAERVLARLPAEARRAHIRAMDRIDHISYVAALKYLEEATEAAPQSRELHLMALDLSRYLGLTRFGTDASAYLSQAIGHAEAILSFPNLPTGEQTEIQGVLNAIREESDTLLQRDETRSEWGLSLAKEYAKRVYGAGTKSRSREIQRFQDAVKIVQQTSGLPRAQDDGTMAAVLSQLAAGFGPEVDLGSFDIAPIPSLSPGGSSGAAPALSMTPPPLLSDPAGRADQVDMEASSRTFASAAATGDAEALARVLTAKARPYATLIVSPVPDATFQFGQAVVDGVDGQLKATILDAGQTVEGRFYLRNEDGKWLVYGVSVPQESGGPVSFIDLEKIGELFGGLGSTLQDSSGSPSGAPPQGL